MTLFERARSLEPVGAAVSVWPNALRALDILGLAAAVRVQATLIGPGGIRGAVAAAASRCFRSAPPTFWPGTSEFPAIPKPSA